MLRPDHEPQSLPFARLQLTRDIRQAPYCANDCMRRSPPRSNRLQHIGCVVDRQARRRVRHLPRPQGEKYNVRRDRHTPELHPRQIEDARADDMSVKVQNSLGGRGADGEGRVLEQRVAKKGRS